MSAATSVSVLLIDNYDSFTFNLVDEFARRGARVEVWRNELSAERALELALALPAPRLIVLSPGPGRPEDAGCCQALVQAACGRVPVFGVCLGLQAIVQALGGVVGPAGEIVHGKSVWIDHEGESVLARLPQPLQVGRYHSLVATRVPEALQVIARYRQLVMAVSHRSAPVIGVQFHPESILTPHGGALIDRTLAWAAAACTPGAEPGSGRHDA
ncbi:MAG: aminodeoxychorismate/anthranilate synthase component II [Proteobacteria bacterium]|nr:aminodeoxychorismate/anthranilate synthase component II [Pseudomonadota bacterium]